LRKKSLEAAEAVRLGKLAVTGLVLARDEHHRATETARANRAAITFDASLYAVLEPLLVKASTAQTIESDVTKRKQGVEKALEVAVAAEGAALDVEGQLNDSRSALVERQRQLQDVEHELEHARMFHIASELRGTLRPGDACPVCTQVITEVPPAEAAAELDTLKAARVRAVELAEATRTRLDQIQQEAAAKRAKAAERRARANALAAELRPLQAQLIEVEAGLARAVASIHVSLAGGELRDWILREVTQTRETRKQAEIAQKSLDEAERKLLEARHAVEKAEQAFLRCNETHSRIEQESGEATSEQERLEQQIAQVTSEPDPDVERNKLQQQADALAVALRNAEQAFDDARRKHDAKAAELAIAATAGQQREQEATHADNQARSAYVGAGFVDADQVKAAILSQDVHRVVSERIQQYETARTQTESRLRELTQALGDGRVTAEAVAAAETSVEDAQQAHNAAVAETARLRGLLERLVKDVTKAQELTRELANARSRLTVFDELARHLGGDRFQQYLLEETFEQLVRGASVRLKQLTGRYTLKWEDDQFYVVDHDNAREQRIAQTLSGGETFLASLALALELSDQILRTAGAVQIDSLFIDEGFGSLDPQSLDVAADAIEGLQAGGRIVGIITHLEALADRLPGCVRIDKRPVDGSLWRIERAG
jgi:exonuclease SbcC